MLARSETINKKTIEIKKKKKNAEKRSGSNILAIYTEKETANTLI